MHTDTSTSHRPSVETLLDQEVHADVVEDAKVALALIRARDGQSPALEETASAKPPALLQQTAWRRSLPRSLHWPQSLLGEAFAILQPASRVFRRMRAHFRTWMVPWGKWMLA